MNELILNQIKLHAQREFPLEACGLILQGNGDCFILECENLSATPETSFLLDPMLQAKHHGKILAVYHSHPNRTAQPSQADIASSERSNLPFLIFSYPEEELFSYVPQGIIHAPYLGRSFVYGVLDCLSLVSDYYRHELNILINDGERKQWGWWDNPENYHSFINGFLAAGFKKVESPKKHDVVIMQLVGVCPSHAAIYLGDNVILHHVSTSAPSREEMFGQYWRQRTICFLRQEAL